MTGPADGPLGSVQRWPHRSALDRLHRQKARSAFGVQRRITGGWVCGRDDRGDLYTFRIAQAIESPCTWESGREWKQRWRRWRWRRSGSRDGGFRWPARAAAPQRNRLGPLGAWVVVQSCCVDCCAAAVALILSSLSVAISASDALRLHSLRPHQDLLPHHRGQRGHVVKHMDSVHPSERGGAHHA